MLLYDSRDMKYSDIYIYTTIRITLFPYIKQLVLRSSQHFFCRLGLILPLNRLIMVLMLNKSFNLGANSVGLIGKLPFVFLEEYVCYVTTIANTRGKGKKKGLARFWLLGRNHGDLSSATQIWHLAIGFGTWP